MSFSGIFKRKPTEPSQPVMSALEAFEARARQLNLPEAPRRYTNDGLTMYGHKVLRNESPFGFGVHPGGVIYCTTGCST